MEMFDKMQNGNLAMFDLDDTLIDGDSEVLWIQYLIQNGLIDASQESKLLQFYKAYAAGELDIIKLQRFVLAPLLQYTEKKMVEIRVRFLEEQIKPIIRKYMLSRMSMHRQQGDHLLIITATNRFITEPIAALFDVDDLLATVPERQDGRYTGNISGTPCFREGKIEHLHKWIMKNNVKTEETWFYSDSHNDIPLLEWVDHPVVVTPDERLSAYAKDHGWAVIKKDT
jgi:HAD superfamily hydrolase (TIGR01490 family)